MTTKKEFNNLLNYLRCHPSDAQLLISVLSEVSNPQSLARCNREEKIAIQSLDISNSLVDQWLSAKEAGKQIGKSSTWIRRRFKEGLFRSARQDEKGKYMFLSSEVVNDYNSYILARTSQIQRL